MSLGPGSISPICENAGPRTKTIWPKMALFPDGKQFRFWPNGFRANHIVSTACRPGVIQIALFEGFPNIPHIPPPPPLPDTQWAQIRQQWHRPPKMLRFGMIPNVPKRYVWSAFLTCVRPRKAPPPQVVWAHCFLPLHSPLGTGPHPKAQ